jgi:hypothetical protein
MLSAGGRNVVVPPRTSRMCSPSLPDWMRPIISAGEERYLTVPTGDLLVSKTL